MTIAGWILFIILAVVVAAVVLFLVVGIYEQFNFQFNGLLVGAIWIIVSAALIIGLYAGFNWYFTNTASGRRAMVNQQSEINNGLERTINIYTADGDLLATYTGKIDIESKEGGYLLFDFEGKRYTYYNCFIESIADIE